MTIVFSVENHHTESCGAPPTWTTEAREPRETRAYFENRYGEQWIASVSPNRFRLTGGDISWRTLQIDGPVYRKLATRCADPSFSSLEGTIVNTEERLWLLAVLTAAVDGP